MIGSDWRLDAYIPQAQVLFPIITVLSNVSYYSNGAWLKVPISHLRKKWFADRLYYQPSILLPEDLFH
jgi:hypothetical protein